MFLANFCQEFQDMNASYESLALLVTAVNFLNSESPHETNCGEIKL